MFKTDEGVKMKHYFATLFLSAFLIPAYAQSLDAVPTSNKLDADPPAPMMAQSIKQAGDMKIIQADHQTECFRVYSTDRYPGLNCIPDH